jgi:hypothetical protein
MKKYITFFTAIMLLFIPNICGAGLLLYDDCEDMPNTTNDWLMSNNTGSYFWVSSEQARAGSKSYKFKLPAYGTVPGIQTNTEIILRILNAPSTNPIRNFKYGAEYWVGYSIYLPKGQKFPSTSGWMNSTQYHSVPDACELTPTSMIRNPMFTMNYKSDTGDRFRWQAYVKGNDVDCVKVFSHDAAGYSKYYNPGQWIDIVQNFRFGYLDKHQPFTKDWVDGVLILDDVGDNAYNDIKGPYLKIGLYGHSTYDTTVYYDEFRVGDMNSSYAEVAPGGSVAPSDPVNIVTQSLGDFVEDETYSGTFSATGGTPPYVWTSADKPAWFTLNANGSWSAAPTSSGSYSFTITATDAESDTDSNVFSGTVIAAAITYPEVLTFGVDYRQTSLTVPITSFTGDENAAAYIVVKDSDTPPTSGDAGWSGTAQTSVTFATEGPHELRAYVKDTSGNVSAPAFASILIDSSYVPPTEPVEDTGPKTLELR